jgi:hypothetical protein
VKHLSPFRKLLDSDLFIFQFQVVLSVQESESRKLRQVVLVAKMGDTRNAPEFRRGNLLRNVEFHKCQLKDYQLLLYVVIAILLINVLNKVDS